MNELKLPHSKRGFSFTWPGLCHYKQALIEFTQKQKEDKCDKIAKFFKMLMQYAST